MRAISLFSGVGGFDLGFERAGIETVLQAERDPHCLKVLERHWPHVRRVSDVRCVGTVINGDGDESGVQQPGRFDFGGIGSVDIVFGGFPCQDLSVAGKRAGLGGERSGLWFEFERIVRELRPAYVVVENVPGLLSSNDGDDLRLILNHLQELGYIIDLDIADAQYFGVPQRRRRVFIVCQSARHLMTRRTVSSQRTMAQALCEILLASLVELRSLSSIGRISSDSAKWLSADGLQKRIRLFGLESESDWRTLLDAWVDASRKCPREPRSSDSSSESPAAPSTPSKTDTGRPDGWRTGGEGFDGSTSRLWSDTWAAVSAAVNSSTTSTPTSSITESRIYGCALTALLIFEHTVRLNTCSSRLSNEESSISIVLKGFIEYARRTGESLFGDLGWVRQWWDFRERAEHLIGELERCPGGGGRTQVLSLCEGCGGNPETRGATGEGTPASIAVRLAQTGSNGWGVGLDGQAYTLDGAQQAVLAHSVTASAGHHGHSSPRGDGSDNLVLANTLKANTGHANGYDRETYIPETAYTIAAREAKGVSMLESQTNYVSTNGVRRLTPLECERLQGFPDGWTDGQADSHRYKQMGNAVCVPVAEWIGHRLRAVDTARQSNGAAKEAL